MITIGKHGANSGELTYKQKNGLLLPTTQKDLKRMGLILASTQKYTIALSTYVCRKGKAITYVEQAADFDGFGAYKQLLLRYDGFSKQKLQSLKKCVEMMKHISGTNITHHIDKFEKLCGQMVNCGFTPTEEDKIDWFLASIHERTYEAMHAHCINLQLQGTLTFGQLVKL